MERFIKVLRGATPVSDAEASAMFGLLIPILETDPAASDAVEAARAVIGRCDLGEDGTLSYVLDWWFVAVTRQSSVNGGAHRLPESLEEAVRQPMEFVTSIGGDIPAFEWLEKKRLLDSRLDGLDDVLSLDHYGPSKLPGERSAWNWLREQLGSTADSLRASQPAERAQMEPRHFEQSLRDNGVDKGSRRWREMLKRCEEAITAVNGIVDLQRDVQPWIRRQLPTALEEVPPGFSAVVGPLAAALLRPLLVANAAPAVSRSDLAQQLDAAARATNASGRYRLARIVDSWCEETGQEVPSLADLVERHRLVRDAMATLKDKHGVDTDMVELHVADDDIAGAEASVGELREELERDQRSRLTRSQYDGLRQKVADAGLGDDDEWLRRLGEIEARLDDGDQRELGREIGATQRRLSAELDEALQEHLEDLQQFVDTLKELDAPETLLFDWRKKILDVESQPGGRGANDLKLELEAEVAGIRQTIRDTVEQRLADVEQILTDERGDFSEADIGAFANRQSEIDSLFHDHEVSDAELVAARARAQALLSDLGEHRIYRWSAADGEESLVDHLVSYCTTSLDFDDEDIRRLHVALKTKPFVILAGLTGSGKSSLTRLYAAALGAHTGNQQFRRVAVRPDWIDQSEVLGFVNPVSQRFVPGWLAETVRSCERRPDLLHFVLLDEMNLAPVEQYLAEMLSAMEEASSGSGDVRLPLYSRGEEPDNADEWPPDLQYPNNLIIVGTVNVDETTRPLSERVIDRANVLHLSVEVSERHHSSGDRSAAPWFVSTDEWRNVCVDVPSPDHHPFLVEVADTLRRANIGVGLRAHVELERFVANAEGVIDPVHALDWGIVQRIIPKIRGFKGPLIDTLKELSEEFHNVGARESAAIVDRWLEDRVSDDEYLDGTDPRLTLART